MTTSSTSSAPLPPPTTPSKPASQSLESILNTSMSSPSTSTSGVATSSSAARHLASSSSCSSCSSSHYPPTSSTSSSSFTSSSSSSSTHQHQLQGILPLPHHPPSTTSSSDRSISPKPMPTPTTLSEWQLLAVLSKANLVQYYDVFIAQGGDDINQIMACEEREFLEIMNLVGMLAKPLHVRRMQRALTEYSHDRTAFNLAALQQIGPPPPLNYTPPGADPMALLLPGIAAATSPNFPSLRFLNQLSSATSGGGDKTTTTTSSSSASDGATKTETSTSTSSNSVPLAFKFAAPLLDHLEPSVAHGAGAGAGAGTGGGGGGGAATANVFAGNSIGLNFGASGGAARHLHPSAPSSSSSSTSAASASAASAVPSTSTSLPFLPNRSAAAAAAGQEKEGSSSPFLVPAGSSGSGLHQQQQPYGNDFVSLGDFDPNNPSSTENPVLSSAQVARIAECSLAASKNLPHLPPRLVQNKKRVSKEVYDLLKTTPGNPAAINDFRRFSAIYGRFDTKRKPHKVLTLHETSVNEAAAQLCLRVPSLLTRRDELFPLARQVVKDAGYNYAKSRKRPCDPADLLHSPLSSPSQSPPPPPSSSRDHEHEFDEHQASTSGGGGGGGGAFRGDDEKPIPPEGWAALIEQMKDESPDS